MNGNGAEEETARAVALSVASLGFAAFVTQVVVLREALSVFSGNELTLGIVLGNWLLLTGLGSFLGRYWPRTRDNLRLALVAQAAVAVAPALQIILFRAAKGALSPGVMVGIGEAFWTSLVLLLPFCLSSGFLLTVLSGRLSTRGGPEQIGTVYLLDTVGGIVGGLVFCFFLVHFFAALQTATLLLVLNLATAFHLARAAHKRPFELGLAGVLLVSLAVLAATDLERLSAPWMLPGGDLVLRRSTPYGDLAVTRQGGQLDVYENGIAVGSTHDPAAAEEIVHYALAQHPGPETVLLVGGGLVGAPREAAKYPVKRIDYVELDPAVLDLARVITGGSADPRLHPIADDARRFLRSKRGEYDAVLMAVPDPSSAQLNRFYTVEFFAEVRRAMRPEGVFSFSLTGAENYASPELRLLASAVHEALRAVFPNILIIPGERQTFVASARPLGYDIAERLHERGIETRFVHGDYLAARLTEDRLAEARRTVAVRTRPNRDFLPVSYYAHLRYWLSQFGTGMLLPFLLVAALLILVGSFLASSRRRAVPAAICASGFAGMGLEVLLLIAFQVCYGYVYQQVGLIILGFMAGAAVGAGWAGRLRADAWPILFRLDASLALTAFLLAPVLVLLAGTENLLLQAVAPALFFPFLTGVVGFLVGAQFPPAARLVFDGVERTAGSLFALDLIGACLGALLVSTFCVPLLGITATCCLVGGLKLITAAALRVQREVALPVAHGAAVPSLETSLSFGVMLLVFVAIGVTIVAEQTSAGVYALSLSPAYYWLLVVLMGLGILRALDPQRFEAAGGRWGDALRRAGRAVRGLTRIQLFRWTYFFAFSLAAFYPIFRCYFRVPYLFCHVCPRKCIFGFVRPFLVPAALIMNLERRLWCYHACPIGTLSDCQARVTRGSRDGRPVLRVVSVAVLGFTAVAYFKIMWDLEAQPTVEHDWYTFFCRNAFAVSAVVILAAISLILLTSRLRRPFCEGLCPVGAFSDLLQRGERGLAGDSMAGPPPKSGPASETVEIRS